VIRRADGDRALQNLDPAQVPVLWPEHFDIGITVAEVNYGVSPGDASIGEPYAYVGPWHVPDGAFWNQPFGAARPPFPTRLATGDPGVLPGGPAHRHR